MRAILTRLRRLFSNLFYQFGIHCATHQIRVILICAVVITSLFYPALVLYAPSKPLTSLTSRLNAYYRSGHTDASALADLQEIWQVYDGDFLVRDDADSRLRCGLDATVRLERVLLPSVHRRVDGALNTKTLEVALELERRITDLLQHPDAPTCVKLRERPDECLVLSPLMYWQREAELLVRDTHPVDTVNTQRNISLDGFAVTPETVFAGFMSESSERADMAQAELLVLSFFFQDDVCEDSEGHKAWLKLLHDGVAELGTIRTRAQQSTMLPLQLHARSATESRISIISVFLYLTYFVVFLNFSGSMRSVNTVHSRLGLAFTGVVEIVASTITSVSVLALWGFRITLVPWGVLPLIMVFVGAENMLFMVNAVGKTPVTLPVKERIALGVSEAGTSNTFKAITYNSVLGCLAVFVGRGAIRQFCVFAIVVLVAHWFLVHTLFLTVLSIDLQRLELSEVLSQDPGLSPNSVNGSGSDKSAGLGRRTSSVSRGRSGTEVVQRLVKSRATKDGSLLLILAVALILYYVTYPTQEPLEVEADPFARHSQPTSQVAASVADSPAVQLWETLNPANKPLIHIRIEPPSIVQFAVKGAEVNSTGPGSSTKPPSLRLVSSERRMLGRLFKIVLLPITCTAGALYLLLIFLLKNAELLDAQHGRANGEANGQPWDWDDGSIAGGTAAGIKFATLPRAFATDIELMAVASDGGVCAAVSSDNVLAIWPPGGHPCTAVELGDARGAVSCIALDARGQHICVGTSSGMVSLWHIDSALGVAVSAGTFVDPVRRGAVLDLGFVRHIDDTLSVVATYDGGCVAEWDTTTGHATMVQPTLSGEVSRTLLIHERDRDVTGVAFLLITGTIEVIDCLKGPGAWSSTSAIQIEPVHDTVVSLNRAHVAVQDGGSRIVLATLSRSGALRIWDGHNSEPMLHLDNIKLSTGEEGSVLLQLAGMPPEMTTCERCREQADGGFTLALGVGETVFVYRATIGDRCACALAGGSKLGGGRRSRSGSAAPPQLRTRGPQRTSTPLDYPISGHGYHSRRASEKESRRNLTVDDDLLQELNNGELVAASGRWRDLTAHCVIDVACERGAWALVDGNRVVGVRRRARGTAGQGPFSLPVVGPSNALSAAVLQRWEAWSVDTSYLSPGSRSSTLYSLSMAANTSPAASARPSRAGSRHSSISSLTTGNRPTAQSPDALSDSVYPRLPFTRASCLRAVKNQCFVGLGNTLGVVQLAPPAPRAPPPVSTRNSSPVISRRGSAGGLNVAFGALGHGLGPPPSVL